MICHRHLSLSYAIFLCVFYLLRILDNILSIFELEKELIAKPHQRKHTKASFGDENDTVHGYWQIFLQP